MLLSRSIFPGPALLRVALAPPLMAMLYLSGTRAPFYAAILCVLVTLFLERRTLVLLAALVGLTFLGVGLFHAGEELSGPVASVVGPSGDQTLMQRFASPFA